MPPNRPVSTIWFATSNKSKAPEMRELARIHGLDIQVVPLKIEELQTEDTQVLIRNKTMQAFERLRLPVIVDHASLRMGCLAGLPGTLTQLFWDRLGGHRLCEIAERLGDNSAEAVSTVGYCDGMKVYSFEAGLSGNIARTPVGTRRFQRDSIFVPSGHSRTYAQMTMAEKNAISQRRQALDKFFEFVTST